MLLAPLLLALPGHGIDLAAMDRSVKVQSPADLYRFANGRWEDRTTIPPDRVRIGKVDEIQERNLTFLRGICERLAASNQPLSTASGKVGLMYRLAMDEGHSNRLGATPLRPELARIDAVREAKGLLREIAHLESIGVQPGFLAGPDLDDEDTTRVLYAIGQPTLTLNDRVLYLGTDARAKAARAQYLKTEGAYLRLAGIPEEGAAQALLLETALAHASSSPTELRNLASNYHKLTRAALGAMTPHTPWDAYFGELGVRPAQVNVREPRALRAFDRLLASRPAVEWRSLLRVSLLSAYAEDLSDAYLEQSFALAHVLMGQRAPAPRWKRTVRRIDATIGEALGQLFVREAFSPEAKAKAQEMARNLLAALHARIVELDWMSTSTKREALAKLATMKVKVGYPDRWRDYSALRLKHDSFAANVMRANAFEWRRSLGELSKPLDRSGWFRTPITVSGYYDANWNEIVFPAGILQPPFFDPKADDASNYGAIGMVMGHEITHGFDDQGSQYDATGLRRDWWTKEDKARYDAKAQAIVDQYDAYVSPNGFRVDGKLTEGENIADVGGLAIAYLAYRRSRHGVEPPAREGLTGDQRFFVACAQCRSGKMRPEAERTRIRIDPHSPQPVRAVGPPADLPAFYRAFGLPVPESLPHVW